MLDDPCYAQQCSQIDSYVPYQPADMDGLVHHPDLVLGYFANQGLEQRRSAAALVSVCADFRYQHHYKNYDDEDRFSLDGAAKPPRLAKYTGIDFCSPIVEVSSLHADNPSRIVELATGLPELRLLSIQETDLHDEDLEAVIGLKHLGALYLRRTQITDGAVPLLAILKSLHVLNVQNTGLSSMAIESLRTALPNTRIHQGPAPEPAGIF